MIEQRRCVGDDRLRDESMDLAQFVAKYRHIDT